MFYPVQLILVSAVSFAALYNLSSCRLGGHVSFTVYPRAGKEHMFCLQFIIVYARSTCGGLAYDRFSVELEKCSMCQLRRYLCRQEVIVPLVIYLHVCQGVCLYSV